MNWRRHIHLMWGIAGTILVLLNYAYIWGTTLQFVGRYKMLAILVNAGMSFLVMLGSAGEFADWLHWNSVSEELSLSNDVRILSRSVHRMSLAQRAILNILQSMRDEAKRPEMPLIPPGTSPVLAATIAAGILNDERFADIPTVLTEDENG